MTTRKLELRVSPAQGRAVSATMSLQMTEYSRQSQRTAEAVLSSPSRASPLLCRGNSVVASACKQHNGTYAA